MKTIVVANQKGGSGKSTIAVHVAVALHKYDFLVIDTPSADGYLTWLALGIADTLITPLNDSFVDFDALGNIDPVTYALIEPSKYAKMVRDERRARRQFDHSDIDWIVMRNRLSTLHSRSTDRLTQALSDLGLQLGFRCARGFLDEKSRKHAAARAEWFAVRDTSLKFDEIVR